MSRNLIFAILTFFVVTLTAVAADLSVIPNPKFISPEQKETNKLFRTAVVNFSNEVYDKASLIELKNYFGKKLLTKMSKTGTLVINFNLLKDLDVFRHSIPGQVLDSIASHGEGYIIVSGEKGVDVFVRTSTGTFYATATLLQMFGKAKGDYTVPMVKVADYPSMKIRGISDDISRGQISTFENFKKIIRFCALYKMNTYMPYIENEYDFKLYPDFSKGRAPLTKEEVMKLDDYARLYHVEIIPIFETLGHMEDVLLKPEFQKYAEFPGAATLCVSDDSTYVFLRNLLEEIAPAFSSKFFNMAADESWDVGLGRSKTLVDSIGLAQAHAMHYKKVYDILKGLGKNVMMYGDIILNNPQILSYIPKDITIVDWHYEGSFNYPSVTVFKRAGFNFIVSPAVWNFTGPFPNFYNSYANIQYFIEAGYLNGAEGAIVSTWNDNGGAELRELNYPGYAWSAECSWNPDGYSSPSRFESAFFKQYFGTDTDYPRIVYELLSASNNQISWYEFWRAPFMPLRSNGSAQRVESILATMPEVDRLIDESKKVCQRNKDILDIYSLVSSMDKFWADRVVQVNKMRMISADTSVIQSVRNHLLEEITSKLISEITRIRNDYVHLYLRTNEKPMLQLLEERFEDQRKYFLDGLAQMRSGNSSYSQTLTSNFIYYPGSKPYSNETGKVDTATFFKSFKLESVPENAHAQLIGDTYCKLFVNGKYVGEVMARRTLTLNVEMQRVKVFDIRPYLKKGENEIVIQAMNFDRRGSAGVNLYALIGKDTLLTDQSWKAAEGLLFPGSKGQPLTSAATYQNGWDISAPNFDLNLKSWIER